jgi:D-psicose/D-tagatose/L-ribulose 3-epimerase
VKPQAFRRRDAEVIRRFIESRARARADAPRLRLSWSNWGFGAERLEVSADRLARNGIRYMELHGNLYGPDLGYRVPEVRRILSGAGISVAGVCGMITPDQEFASNRPHVRQRAIDYFRRQIEFCAEVGGSYILFGVGAVGRPQKYDDFELERAAETIRLVADDFGRRGIRAAIEPIRPEETSVCHTFADAERIIGLIDHAAVQWINGDLYHMLAGEEHIGETILQYGDRLINLHMADTNRRALGRGLLDLDLVLMALYAVGYNEGERYCTPEPLGPGGNPYESMFGEPDPGVLDDLVAQTAATFHEREAEILAASDVDLLAAGLAAGPARA